MLIYYDYYNPKYLCPARLTSTNRLISLSKYTHMAQNSIYGGRIKVKVGFFIFIFILNKFFQKFRSIYL